MKDLHYGEGYIYAHDTEEKLSRMQCMPDALVGRRYYHPTTQGQERQVGEHLRSVLEWKQEESEC